MGHTVSAYSLMVEAEYRAWKKILKLETKEDKEAYEHLFTHARLHNSAGVYMSHPWPIATILFSILLN
jgi:hypothetical protein